MAANQMGLCAEALCIIPVVQEVRAKYSGALTYPLSVMTHWLIHLLPDAVHAAAPARAHLAA